MCCIDRLRRQQKRISNSEYPHSFPNQSKEFESEPLNTERMGAPAGLQKQARARRLKAYNGNGRKVRQNQ